MNSPTSASSPVPAPDALPAVDFQKYREANRNRPHSARLESAIELAAPGGRSALDVGSGACCDVRFLRTRGYVVTALDGDKGVYEEVAALGDPWVKPLAMRLEDLSLPPAAYDFINAQFSLFFCAPDRFDRMFASLLASLASGGLFHGNLLGPRDGWCPNPEKTFLERGQAEALFAGLEILEFNEMERDATLSSKQPHHWHEYVFTVRRPA